MKLRHFSLMASIGLAALLVGGSSSLAQSLATAETFAVLGAQTVTNTGFSIITGNLGVSLGNSVNGFPPGTVVGGTIHLADPVALQAQNDVTTAFNALADMPCSSPANNLTGQNLDGRTLAPGVYCFSTAVQFEGTLTLDAQNNPNAVFVFQIPSWFTTASGSVVNLINGAQNCSVKVFWHIGSTATLGIGSTFVGNILARASITLQTGATLSGRALSRTGAVTLDTNTVSICHGHSTCPVIAVNPTTLPGGIVGTPYLQTISAAGSTALPYTFLVSSGTLPDGLSLDASTGVISGTPTTVGYFAFTVTATDVNGCTGNEAYAVFPILPAACSLITLSPSTLPNGVFGTPYLQALSVAPPGEYTFVVSIGALPDGLRLNVSTGIITGTPTAVALFGFTITVTAPNGCNSSQAYFIRILPPACPIVTLSSGTLTNGAVGTAYNQTVSAFPPGTYTFLVTVGILPNGLSLNTSTGVITGVPTTIGSFDFTITATNASLCTGHQAYSIRILPAACPIVTVSPSALPGGALGVAYHQTISASPPGLYIFSILHGPLPIGLSLNTSTGGIAGTPATIGSFNFTIAATNANGCVGTQAYTVTIFREATTTTTSTTTTSSTTTTTTTGTTTTTMPPGWPLTTMDFPQLAVGGGYRAFLALDNPNNAAVQVFISFRDQAGGGMMLQANGTPMSSMTFYIQALGSVKFQLEDPGPQAKSGWCQVFAAQPISGILVYQTVDGGQVLAEATVLPSVRHRKFSLMTPQLGSPTEIGLALANPEDQSVVVTLKRYTSDGLMIAETNLVLGSGEQSAKFVSQFFPSNIAQLEGRIEISSIHNIVGVGLIFQTNSQGFLFTTLPIVALP